jgi:ribosomal protein S18 acetylase RimI-like enzyme
MTELHFRDATLADVPAVVALVTSAYRGEASRAGWTTEADLLDGARIDPDLLRADIEREGSRVLLAELEAPARQGLHGSRDAGTAPALVACAHVAVEDGAGYFGMFAVRPGLQRGGIGHALLREAERIVGEEWRLPLMRMGVIDLRDELIAWYQRRGYRRTGVFRPFPYGDTRFGIPRRDDLRFEVLEKPL